MIRSLRAGLLGGALVLGLAAAAEAHSPYLLPTVFDASDRKVVMNDIIPFLEKAFTGEPFEWKGRTVRVTPRPAQRPRPPIFMGGASKAAARRAAHFADALALKDASTA